MQLASSFSMIKIMLVIMVMVTINENDDAACTDDENHVYTNAGYSTDDVESHMTDNEAMVLAKFIGDQMLILRLTMALH